jgi:hypothetical protein
MILQEITIGTGPDAKRRQTALMFREDLPAMAGNMVRLWFEAEATPETTVADANAVAKARARELLTACLAALGN